MSEENPIVEENPKEEAKALLAEIKDVKAKISKKIEEIDTFYTQSEELRTKVLDEEAGSSAVLAKATELKQQVDTLRSDSQTKFDEIEDLAKSVSKKIEEIDTFYTQFEELRTKVLDEETGLEAILAESKEFKSEISATKKVAGDTYLEIQGLKKDSEELKKLSKADRDIIEGYRKETGDCKASILEILEFVTDGSRTNAFRKRAHKLQTEVFIWGAVMVAGIIALGLAVLYIFNIQSKAVNGFTNLNEWSRYLFTSPIIYLIYIASKNYDKARDLWEKYEYKNATSSTLPADVKLLREEFPQDKDSLLKFTLDKLNRIYKEPYSEKGTKSRIFFGLKNIVNGGFEFDELPAKTDETENSEGINVREMKVLKSKKPAETPQK